MGDDDNNNSLLVIYLRMCIMGIASVGYPHTPKLCLSSSLPEDSANDRYGVPRPDLLFRHNKFTKLVSF